jgi:hypothetical protein
MTLGLGGGGMTAPSRLVDLSLGAELSSPLDAEEAEGSGGGGGGGGGCLWASSLRFVIKCRI